MGTALDEVERHCNFCTSIMDRVIAGVDGLNEEAAAEQRMPMMCQQVGLDACFSDNPDQCLWAVDDLGFNELPTAEECAAEGHPTAQFDDNSGAHCAPVSFIGAALVLLAQRMTCI